MIRVEGTTPTGRKDAGMKVDGEICVAMHRRPLVRLLEGPTAGCLPHGMGPAATDTEFAEPGVLAVMQSAIGGSVPEPGCPQDSGSHVSLSQE